MVVVVTLVVALIRGALLDLLLVKLPIGASLGLKLLRFLIWLCPRCSISIG